MATRKTKKVTKPISFKVFASPVKAKISPQEEVFRGRVVAAGPARITVEIEVDDDHGLRKGSAVLLVPDSERELDELAARIDDAKAAEMRELLRKPGMRGANSGALTREILKRRRRLGKAKA